MAIGHHLVVGVETSLETSELVDLLILDMKEDFLILHYAEIGQIMQRRSTEKGIGLKDLYHWTGAIEIAQGIMSSMRGKGTREEHHLPHCRHCLHVANGVAISGREVDLQLEEVHH